MAKYLFDSFVADVDERRLLRGDEDVRIRGKGTRLGGSLGFAR